jgi:hypothetical protein
MISFLLGDLVLTTRVLNTKCKCTLSKAIKLSKTLFEAGRMYSLRLHYKGHDYTEICQKATHLRLLQ